MRFGWITGLPDVVHRSIKFTKYHVYIAFIFRILLIVLLTTLYFSIGQKVFDVILISE